MAGTRPARIVVALGAGCALVLPGAASADGAVAVPPEGGFFQIKGYDTVYEIVGGAPVAVTNWAAVGGRRPTLKATPEIWNELADYPRDGTFVQASDGRAYRFVGGAPVYISTWKAFGGNQKTLPVDAKSIDAAGAPFGGPFRSIRDRVWDFDGDGRHVFNVGNPPSPTPFNGHLFIRSGQTGRVYKMVGGAPLYVSDWKAFRGPKPAITVDQAAIDHAGGAGQWRFLRKTPADGWAIRGAQTNQLYIIAGAAPIHATASFAEEPNVWPPRARWIPSTVDQAVIDRSGGPAPYDNLRFYPADGTGLRIRPLPGSDTVAPWPTFRVINGVPVAGQSGIGPEVDPVAIQRAGEPGPWAHLRAPS